MKGIQNFLEFLNQNWTSIMIIIGLIIALYEKIKIYVSKSNEEKIEIAKKQIKEVILKMITDAEFEYNDISKFGKVKRSEVIKQIYNDYPILSKVSNQDDIIAFIDETIDSSLVVLREAINNK